MSLDPEDRLEALRREVLAEPPPGRPAPPPAASSAAPPAAPAAPAPRPVPVVVKDIPPVAEPVHPDSDGRLGLGDLDMRALLADRSLSDWLGIGLLVVGGYLL